eukprot:gene26055-36335_t
MALHQVSMCASQAAFLVGVMLTGRLQPARVGVYLLGTGAFILLGDFLTLGVTEAQP